VVTDPGIVACGVAERVVAALRSAGLEPAVFDQVAHMATTAAAEAGAAAARAHRADAVVGVGGGSALAVARGVAILMAEGGDVASNAGRPARSAPLFSVPTTAGSGSEVSPSAPLLDRARGAKITLSGPGTFSRVAVLDPDLLASLPARQAALSGVDALTHGIEAYLTNLATPITDALAIAAVELLGADLRAAVAGDGDARARCLVASTMANQACGNAKLGLVHGLARNIQTLFEVPYGVTIGVLLVPVMEFNRPAALGRFARLAGALGEPPGADEGRSTAAVTRVKRLLADIGIPRRFEAVDRSRIAEMARMVFARHTSAQLDRAALAAVDVSGFAPSPNLRRATFDDIVALYEASLAGWEPA
jgi:alcohol dehydrogenase class IV